MTKNRSAFSRRKSEGFALVITLSLLVLLVVISVGLLSLSSISLRASGSSLAMAEARSNARMALQMALGQLQLLTGQDTRVTAPRLSGNSQGAGGSVVPVTGAWRSWEGTDHETNGKPKAPDYSLKQQAGDPSAEPKDASSDGRFLGWLTSTAAFSAPDASNVPDVQASSGTGFVPLVADGSVIDANRRVYMKPTYLDGQKGAIAWWTSGDNSKALIATDRVAEPSSVVAWQERLRGNGRADREFFGLEKVDQLGPDAVIPTTGSLKLVSPAAELKKIHDLTGYNRGLLTNTATGGWRRDLSLFSERYSALPSSRLPLFTLSPGKIQTYSKAPSSGNAANPLIYPWATYRNGASGSAWEQVPPISSWTAMVDYMLQYKAINSSSATSTRMPVTTVSSPKGGAGGDRFKFVDQVRRFPQIARMQWIYSLTSLNEGANAPDKSKPYKAGLLITPVLSIWNPYNVRLDFNAFEIRIQQTSPMRFQFKVGTQILPPSSISEITRTDTDTKGDFIYEGFVLRVPAGSLEPGDSRIYGVNDPTPRIDSRAAGQKGVLAVDLTAGYRPNGGYMFFGLNKGQFVYAAGGESFGVERVSYDGATIEGGRDGIWKPGIGFLYDLVADGESFSHRMAYNVSELGGDALAAELYPPLTRPVAAKQIASVEKEKNQPFASAIFGYRMASPMSGDLLRHKHLFTKGMLQATPLCGYTEIGFGDHSNAVTTMAGSGVYHPANAPYDFAFQDVEGWADSAVIPEFERTTNRTYIVSGLASRNGLTRCVMAEVPTRPLQSLADLQHFDARNMNPITPFQFNLIGNGSAHPIFAPNQALVKTAFNDGMCNDDAYMLNHLLFDDWFVSSIAPDLRDFRNSAERTINNVYKDHLELTTPLPNRLYHPSADAAVVDGEVDVAKAVTNAISTSKNPTTGLYAFESIASKLEVAGMFNINSVSLDAWKALLRQSRDAEVPYLSANGRTQTDAAVSYSYPRTSIAGDRATNSGSGESNAGFPAAAEFAGHRALTDEQIDALAQEIVNEVNKRGPFLSLAEFVNRRLTSDKDLAIAGTIQKALDNLAAMGASSKNPFAKLQENSVHITSLPPDKGTLSYKFPEAAYGWSAFGVPGWVRQADILRPIAPIISARDDTFTIRAYGDSRDRANPDKIVARAWCEVVVRRNAAYIDPADPAEIAPYATNMKSQANRRFGRRYEVVAFRWLGEGEV